MTTCPFCGFEIEPGLDTCPVCASVLVTCPECAEYVAFDATECNHCQYDFPKA
jgi:hypothetical protein